MKHGFTLVETLVALFILSLALTGVFGVISFNLASARSIGNSLIASGLAEEGVEIVRNLRDSDWLHGDPFGTFGDPSGKAVGNGTYRVSWDSESLEGFGTDSVLLRDPRGMYGYGAGTPTPFHRVVTIERVGNPAPEIIVTVTVTWDERYGTKKIVAEEHLYDWY